MSKQKECENCGCDEQNTGWNCSDCGEYVVLCLACNTIIEGCECGYCAEGEIFIESDD